MSRRRVLWSPPSDARQTTRLGRFWDRAEARRGERFATYEDLWAWSVGDLEGFWSALWDEMGVVAHAPPTAVLDPTGTGAGTGASGGSTGCHPGARWFPGASLSYAEHALTAAGRRGPEPVVWSDSQTRPAVVLTGDELVSEVARVAAGLAALGVRPGDRVAAYLPNIAETLVAFLATAGLGAVWSSCPPEFGVRSVVDRFGQIAPTVLLVVDGYRYGDKTIDRRADVATIRGALPGLRATIAVPYLDPGGPAQPDTVPWSTLGRGEPPAPPPVPVPFDHPLYILYSSGTTGLPKPIVHGHGGILLEHLKALALHLDLGPGDRFSWFSTTGWMMWNFLVSGLLVGAGVVLFDGDPGFGDLAGLWRLAADRRVTHFGTSAPFLMANRKAGVVPAVVADLDAVRVLGSTGAPLPAEGYEWVYANVGADLLLSSISGGTDVCTAFCGGNPLVAVCAGEMSSRYLGCDVRALGPAGRPVVGEQGELVLGAPMPSMPVGFWNDPDGARYRAAYFDAHPGWWTHGDWITIADDGACVISGRSDATLNRGGVRLGTSDFYRVVEELDDIRDSLVVHLDDPAEPAGRLVLFVALAPGRHLDDGLRSQVAAVLRRELSPRHVPDEMVAVPMIPRTLSGKKLEVPVKRLLEGAVVTEVVSEGALADPAALDAFVAWRDR